MDIEDVLKKIALQEEYGSELAELSRPEDTDPTFESVIESLGDKSTSKVRK